MLWVHFLHDASFSCYGQNWKGKEVRIKLHPFKILKEKIPHERNRTIAIEKEEMNLSRLSG